MSVILALMVWVVLSGAPASDDVFIASLSFPSDIARWFEEEAARLEKRCPDRECSARELERKTWSLNPVHSSPDPNSPRLGHVVVSAAETDGWPHLRFDYRPVQGRQAVWLDADEIGDWGYGIYAVVRGKRGTARGEHPAWIELGGVPGPAWIELKPTGPNDAERLITGELDPITDTVLTVGGGIPAVNRRTGARMLLPTRHNYVVERARGAELFLRQEVGADMPCGRDGHEKDVPTAATPRYRVAVRNLFRRDGAPLLSVAYPRGC